MTVGVLTLLWLAPLLAGFLVLAAGTRARSAALTASQIGRAHV